MGWPKTIPRIIPVPKGTAVSAEVRWGIAESAWRYAAGRGLTVLSFRETDPVPVADVPKSVYGKLGASRDEFDWHRFEVVVDRA